MICWIQLYFCINSINILIYYLSICYWYIVGFFFLVTSWTFFLHQNQAEPELIYHMDQISETLFFFLEIYDSTDAYFIHLK